MSRSEKSKAPKSKAQKSKAPKQSIDPGQVRLYSASQARELDRVAIEEFLIPGLTLMKRAAESCVTELLRRWPDARRIAVFCGSGNNAGDGYIVAGLLAAKGISVKVMGVGRIPDEAGDATTDAGQAYQFWVASQAEVDGATIESVLQDAEIVVDAILGTGVSREVQGVFRDAIKAINESNLPVLSVDLPSGLCADTGRILGQVVKALVTVTFIGRKIGLFTNDGPQYVGEVVFASLDVPEDVYRGVQASAEMLSYEQLVSLVPPRHRNAHKVSHGHLLLVGGDEGMGGAISMAAEAALYTGAGMVSVVTRSSNVNSIVARCPEIMARGVNEPGEITPLLERATAVVLGPGLGTGAWGRNLFDLIVASDLPLLLDADGLNILASKPIARGNWVLTPHPGEASRLLAGTDIQADRLAAAGRLLRDYTGVILLKGAGTLIVSENMQVALNPYGNPGMAVAGMGDVLSGIVGSLIAQGLPLWDAARLGAVIHSLSADQKVAEQGVRGLLATELLPVVRDLINGIRKGSGGE